MYFGNLNVLTSHRLVTLSMLTVVMLVLHSSGALAGAGGLVDIHLC